MSKIPSYQDLLCLINDVARMLETWDGSSEAISLEVKAKLHAWFLAYDVRLLDRYCQCMLESFKLAANRGLSGAPADVERSIRSLDANVQYYCCRMLALSSQKPMSRQSFAINVPTWPESLTSETEHA